MIREVVSQRPDWQHRLEAAGMNWHRGPGELCWNESAVYCLSEIEIQQIRSTAIKVYALYKQAAAHVVQHGLWGRLGFHEEDAPIIQASWERQDRCLLSRFDFLLDEYNQPRLIEFNAETALSLVESGPAQKQWQNEVMPQHPQFNELHERLVSAWHQYNQPHIHCAWRPRHPETIGTLRYMSRVIAEAGFQTTLMAMQSIGWDPQARSFVDQHEVPIQCCYKIYPGEWMLREPFARHLVNTSGTFIEPMWRLMFSSKGMLALLWELFPNHPALLPAYADTPASLTSFVRKPFFGREGGNISIFENTSLTHQQPGEPDDQMQFYQALLHSPRHDGRQAQLGVWMVGEEPAALGIRESQGPMITGDSPFVPHVIRQG